MEWLNNPENEKEVRTLIEENIGCFRFEDDSGRVEARLQELGENKILEELKKGTFGA